MKAQHCVRRRRRSWLNHFIRSLAVLLAIIGVAAALLHGSHAPQPVTTGPGPSQGWYFRMQQWRADARTAVAMVEYVLQFEPEIRSTNESQPFELAMPTNSAAVVPKA